MGTHTVKVGGRSLLPAPSGGSKEERRKLRHSKDAEKDLKKVSSKFGLSVRDINKMIETGDTERAVGYFQKKLLSAIVALIPIAEKQYKKSKSQSQAYAMNAMISTARELAQDLQATADRKKLAQQIAQDVLMPAFRSIVQSIVDEHYILKKDLEDDLQPKRIRKGKERVDATAKNIAKLTQQIYVNLAERINEMLVR